MVTDLQVNIFSSAALLSVVYKWKGYRKYDITYIFTE